MNVKAIISDAVFEPTRFNDPAMAYYYAKRINGRFPEGEEAISWHADWSLSYAANVLHGPFPLGERSIIREKNYLRAYLAMLMELSQGEYLQACIRMGIQPEL